MQKEGIGIIFRLRIGQYCKLYWQQLQILILPKYTYIAYLKLSISSRKVYIFTANQCKNNNFIHTDLKITFKQFTIIIYKIV